MGKNKPSNAPPQVLMENLCEVTSLSLRAVEVSQTGFDYTSPLFVQYVKTTLAGKAQLPG